MKSIDEGNGSLLDDSTVLYGSSMKDGNGQERESPYRARWPGWRKPQTPRTPHLQRTHAPCQPSPDIAAKVRYRKGFVQQRQHRNDRRAHLISFVAAQRSADILFSNESRKVVGNSLAKTALEVDSQQFTHRHKRRSHC